MLLHWLWFAHRPHLSSGAKAALLRHFSDAEDIFCAPEQALAEAGLTLCSGVTGSADKAAQDYLSGTLQHGAGANCDHHLPPPSSPPFFAASSRRRVSS